MDHVQNQDVALKVVQGAGEELLVQTLPVLEQTAGKESQIVQKKNQERNFGESKLA